MYFSKVLYIVTLYRKYARVMTLENVRQEERVRKMDAAARNAHAEAADRAMSLIRHTFSKVL
jgi:hypothetical protein